MTQHAKVVEKKGHWQAKCQSCNTTIPQASHHQLHFKHYEKGREPQAAKAKTEKRPPHKDLLTAYNGSPIPLYGILHGPILWQPNTPGAQPYMIHSYWYIVDTPSPALLGLPACKKLAVVQVNCAVGTTQPDRRLTGTHPLRQQEQQNQPQQEHQSPSASNPLMT